MKTVVSFSGGIDSTVCCAIAKNRGDEVIAVSFNYRQRNINELKSAEIIASMLKLNHIIVDAGFISKLIPSFLTMNKMDESEGGFINTFIPGRNMLFSAIIGIVAYMNKADNIMIGVNAADNNSYPDCRPQFVRAMHKAINYALDTNIKLEAPLLELDKSQIFEKAAELKILPIILEETVTCYKGIKGEGCGECPACELRREGYSKYILEKGNIL